jgi:hypothetical protein
MLGELEGHARRERYLACTEPNRLTVDDYDPESGEWIDGSSSALHPDSVYTITLLEESCMDANEMARLLGRAPVVLS